MNSDKSSNQQPRLIVLLPQSLVGNLDFAQWVHRQAVRDQMDVLFLILLDSSDELLSVLRRIETMKAMTESNLIRATSIQVRTAHWFGKLKEIIRPGDIVVSHEEQVVRQDFFNVIPVSVFLANTLKQPVISVRNYYHPQATQIKKWMFTALFWIGALVILGGFSLLEIQADALISGSMQKLAVGLLILIEFGSVWLWSRMFNH